MKVSVKQKAITTTALISMTDVVFLLLIFLLLTSNFITYTGIPINVPTSQNAHTEIQKNITIAINDKDEIFLNDVMVTRENLEPKLKGEVDKNPDVIIMIQADQNIALKKVIELIDTAKSAGSSRFFIAAHLVRARV